MQYLNSFFRKAENGFKVASNKKDLITLFNALFKAKKIDRFILFLQLLKGLNQVKYEGLSSFVSEKKYKDTEGQRMSAVFAYTMNHFQKEITLETIAREAAMTKNAFCKYFKKRTNKTYFTFLNELRIEESCRLLQRKEDLSVAEVAERSGFQNISHFNRKFKLFKGKTPRAYRNAFML
jgi:AraC-like DNA-binding protein